MTAFMVSKERFFVTLSEVISKIDLPKKRLDLTAFRGLMKFQYDFSDNSLDYSMAALLKEQYWKQISPDYLIAIRNRASSRFGQVGTVLGCVTGQIAAMFGDGLIERFIEDELLLLEKKKISLDAGVNAQFLDDKWEKIKAAGRVSRYQPNAPDQRPFGWYHVQLPDGEKKVEDWWVFSAGEVRFIVTDTSKLAGV